MVNKSATKIGTIQSPDGGPTNTLFLGHNSNTGATIVWQKVTGRRASRVTGRNIVRLVAELDGALADGDTNWIGGVNQAALDALRNTTA